MQKNKRKKKKIIVVGGLEEITSLNKIPDFKSR